MKALVWHGAGDLRYEGVVDPPDPAPGQAVVRVTYCGICGTDLGEFDSGPHMIRSTAHPLTGWTPPFALGHEIAGTVVSLGSERAGFSVGDRVAVDPCWRCASCRWCIRGEYHLCPSGGAVGLASPGGFAEAVTVPLEGLVALPESVSDRVAAFAEPMAVGLHAVARGEVRPGDNVLVFGGGAVGIAVLLAARLAGAAQLFLSEPLAARRELGLRFGATETYDPSRADVPREAYLRTGRIGPDVVFEASGHPQVVLDAISSVRRGGRVVLAGIGQRPVPIDLTRLTLFERSVVGTLGYNFDLPRVVSLLASGRLDEVVGLTLVDRPLSAGAEVFAELRADPARHLKVLLAPRMG